MKCYVNKFKKKKHRLKTKRAKYVSFYKFYYFNLNRILCVCKIISFGTSICLMKKYYYILYTNRYVDVVNKLT